MPEIYMEKFNVNERHWAIRALLLQERMAGRLASAVLTVEERLKEILSNRGIRREKIHVLMNLPDELIFQPMTQTPKAPGQPFVIVYHGTLARRLGLDIAVQAVAKVRERIGAVELRIIGDGEERGPLVKLAGELGLDGVVTFSDGFVPVNQIPGMLQDADAAVIPLRKCCGTDIMLPTKLLEYVCLGIPAITPKTGTIARYFDESMVRFFEAEDADSLAEAILYLYEHPQEREQLRRSASEKFLAKYRWSEHKRVYTGLVKKLLGERTDQPAVS
jgi:glycosyltransferase involved in cell wall biosynthesis